MEILIDWFFVDHYENLTGDNKKALGVLNKTGGYDNYSLRLSVRGNSFFGKLFRKNSEIAEIHAYCFKDTQTLLKHVRAAIAEKYPMEQWPGLKTRKKSGNCEVELFPVVCPHNEKHIVEGILLPTNVGSIHCRTNLCGYFEGISTNEQIVYCSYPKN